VEVSDVLAVSCGTHWIETWEGISEGAGLKKVLLCNKIYVYNWIYLNLYYYVCNCSHLWKLVLNSTPWSFRHWTRNIRSILFSLL